MAGDRDAEYFQSLDSDNSSMGIFSIGVQEIKKVRGPHDLEVRRFHHANHTHECLPQLALHMKGKCEFMEPAPKLSSIVMGEVLVHTFNPKVRQTVTRL